MKKSSKAVFFIVCALTLFLAYSSFFGIDGYFGDIRKVFVKSGDDIRWGIDIRGGVDVTFTPPETINATRDQMTLAEGVVTQRLVSQNITDSEVYTDFDKKRIIVRFPWKENESDFDPEAAIKEIGTTAKLEFREGSEVTGALVVEGKDIDSAAAAYDTQKNANIVSLKFNSEGAAKFAEVTERLAVSGGSISIWLDGENISTANVQEAIPDGNAQITGNFTAEQTATLARQINSGALPFALNVESFSTIDPVMGEGAKNSMLFAGIIAYILVVIFIVLLYRLPGCVAAIGLLGQIAGAVVAISGYFSIFPSFTLTLPGIAGIILSIGMGVDANIITASRIRDELNEGRTLDGAIQLGTKHAFSAIMAGNITVIIVAAVLMGAFGPPGSFFSTLLKPVFFMFGPSTTGAVYSFGYTLLMGTIFNFIFGVTASRLMITSLSRFKAFQNPWLYGGEKA
ncbi:MAG: MMPL family transporter [Oscillospiraceae bacterium]|jgi:protein-export SecD/SecF family membrane protein|nr:MMPL family transporter [Oscillospiraceae bacterium]